MTKTLKAECFCGEVRLEINGAQEAMGYCHCDSCRHWSAGPVNAFSLWVPANIQIIQGKSKLQTCPRLKIASESGVGHAVDTL